MSLFALCSGKGSPGVSTLACLVGAVWRRDRRIVIAECDPSGNDLAARFGLSPRTGMTSLALAHRRPEESDTAFGHHLQSLPGGLEVLVGPVTPDAAGSLDREVASVGTGMFPHEMDVLIDCGRVLSGSLGQQQILKEAEHVIMVARPDAAALAHASWTLDILRSLRVGVTSFVVVGPIQFPVSEMEKVFRARLLGAIPHDEKSASMVCGTPGRRRRFARSSLVKSARNLADQLLSGSIVCQEPVRRMAASRVDDVGGLVHRAASTTSASWLATSGELGADVE